MITTNNFYSPTIISLFSGCGGLDLGFEGDFSVLSASINLNINSHWNVKKIDDNWVKLDKTIFNTVFANDIRPDAKSAWVNYFSKKGFLPSIYYLDSIVDLVKSHKESKAKIFPNADIVIGGFPCQDFSVAGKRKGFDSNKSHDGKKINIDSPSIENRGQLYIWLREVVSIVQPKMFIAENVKGLVNLENVKEIIENDFACVCDSGYLVVPAIVLHAANYGVPQNRERIIFYGFKKSALNKKALEQLSSKNISSEYIPYPTPTHFYNLKDNPNKNLLPFVTVEQSFNGLLEPNETSDIAQKSYSKAKYMGKHCQGQTEVNLQNIAPTIRSEHHGNIEYRRLSKENGGRYINELKSGMQERRLTIRECARIQTFPDDYEFIIPSYGNNKSVTTSDAYKLIGNAVPPLLGYHIAKKLEDNWKKYFE